MTGIDTVPSVQRTRYDRINLVAQQLKPGQRRLDYIEAIALAVDTFDNLPDLDRNATRQALGRQNPALWGKLMNRSAAIAALQFLIDDAKVASSETVGAPV